MSNHASITTGFKNINRDLNINSDSLESIIRKPYYTSMFTVYKLCAQILLFRVYFAAYFLHVMLHLPGFLERLTSEMKKSQVYLKTSTVAFFFVIQLCYYNVVKVRIYHDDLKLLQHLFTIHIRTF